MRAKPPGNQEQEFRIKALLAQRRDGKGRRLNMMSLARALGESYGNVASTIYDKRPGTPMTKALQVKIAAFLGLPVAELFGGNGAQVRTPAPPESLGQRLKRVLGFKPAAAESEA